MFRTSKQLKDNIANLSRTTGIPHIVLQRRYMLDRFLERISRSKYRDAFILKGGMLISDMVGVASRATQDLDTTVKGLPLTPDYMKKIVEEIAGTDIGDAVSFTVTSTAKIMEGAEYEGIRFGLSAAIQNMVVPIKVDISTGDVITPEEVGIDYKLMFEDRYIHIRRGPKRGSKRLRRGDLRYQHRPEYGVAGHTKQAGGHGHRAAVRAVVPVHVCGHLHLGHDDLRVHRDLWAYDRDIPCDEHRAHPHGDYAQPGMGQHGAELSSIPAGAGLPGVSHHRLCSDLYAEIHRPRRHRAQRSRQSASVSLSEKMPGCGPRTIFSSVAAERHCRKTDGAVCRRQPRLFGASRIGLRSGRRPLLGEIKPLHHPGQFVPYGHQ